MSEEQNDALTVARWCWPPSDQWRHGERDPGLAINDSDDGSVECFDPENPYDVRDAESVLIERGLAEQYGDALIAELGKASPLMIPDGKPSNGRTAAIFAMAPLASRLRALARVARENPEAKT